MNRVARGNDVRPGISRRVAVSALKRQETATETAKNGKKLDCFFFFQMSELYLKRLQRVYWLPIR
jgi:hypothetical protein